ncbi:MAG: hypothetical protein C4523_11265 [Myxococcales bacterium]|nr:MAG: hypothetical protein C4523_11265 [Myxococcales bacterium]
MRQARKWTAGLAFLLAFAFACPAAALDAETEVGQEQLKAKLEAEKQPDGWYFRFKPSANASYNNSQSVVGQPTGSTFTFGTALDLLITLRKGDHEWRNTLYITEAISRTPVIDEFIISADDLKFESMYLYYFKEWVGVYGRLALDTSIFPGYDVQPAPTLYAIKRQNGGIDYTLDDKIKLTDPFQPLTLKEGVGPFFRPLAREAVNLEIMLGLGAWQTFANGQLTVDDDGDTPLREIKELENVYQLGAENLYKLWGDLWEKRIGYLVAAEFMMPFVVIPDNPDVSGIDKLNINLNGRIDFRFTAWASLTYELKAIKESQILNAWQVQNNLLLTFSYALDEYVAL